MKKRLLAMFLTVAMLIGLLPTTAFTLDLSSEEPPVPVYSAAYAADVAVDGVLQETGWITDGKMTSAEGSRSYGALWKSGTVYFAVKLDAADTKVTIVLNEKKITVTQSGVSGVQGASSVWADGIVEIGIPTAEAGFSICDYTQTVPFEIAVGDNTFEGALGFNSVVRAESNLDADAYVESYNHGENHEGEYDFAQSTAVENGYTIQLKQENNNPTFYDIHRTATAANPLDTAAGTVTVEFNLNIESLTAIAGGRIGQYWSSEGVVVWVSDNSGKQLVYSVYYAKDHKLYLSYCQGPHGASIGTPICLDKTLKEDFRLRVDFRSDGSGEVYVDGVRKGFMENALLAAKNAALPENSIRFHAFEYGKPENTNEFTFSNIAVGTSMGGSILDQVDFDAIKADNTSANTVISDLNLLASVGNSQLGEQSLTWSSSMTDVIANDGKVKRNAENNKVTMTAALTDCPAIKKDLAMVVSRLRTEAYATKEDMTVDGVMNESFWGTVNPMTGANAGNLFGTYQASWSRRKLYLGLTHKNATKAAVSLGEWLYEFNLNGGVINQNGITGATVGDANANVTWNNDAQFDSFQEQVSVLVQPGSITNVSGEDFKHISATQITNGVKLSIGASTAYLWDYLRAYPSASVNLNHTDAARVISFDLKVNAMPANTTTGLGGMWPSEGLTARAADGHNNMLNFAIGNVSGELHFIIRGSDESTITKAALGKAVGDQFNLKLLWDTDNSLKVAVDGTVVKTFTAAEATRTRTYSNGSSKGVDPNFFEFWLLDYQGTATDAAEVEVTNFRTGTYTNIVWNSTLPTVGAATTSGTADNILAQKIPGSYTMKIDADSTAVLDRVVLPFSKVILDHEDAASVLSFDMQFASIPLYNGAGAFGSNWASLGGLTGYARDGSDNVLLFAVTNVENQSLAKGLYFTVKANRNDNASLTSIPLNKQAGDKFNLALVWNPDGSLTVKVDGVAAGSFTAEQANCANATGLVSANSLKLELTNHKNYNKNNIVDQELNISNIRTGTIPAVPYHTTQWNSSAPATNKNNFVFNNGAANGTYDWMTATAINGGFKLKINAAQTESINTITLPYTNVSLNHTEKASVLSFDMKYISAPVHNNIAAIGGVYASHGGLTGYAQDGNGNVLLFAVACVENTANNLPKGLYFTVKRAKYGTISNIALGKQIGDKFNLSLVWNTDESLTVKVDGKTVGTVSSSLANCSDGIDLVNANSLKLLFVNYKNLNSTTTDYEVEVSNIRTGTEQTVTEEQTLWNKVLPVAGTVVENDYNNGDGEYANMSVEATANDGQNLVINASTGNDTVYLPYTNVLLDHTQNASILSFDLQYTSAFTCTGIGGYGGAWPHTGGLTGYARDNNNKVLLFGVANIKTGTLSEGLYFTIKKQNANGTDLISYVALSKQVGDKFNLSLVWNQDDSLTVLVDGEEVKTFTSTEALCTNGTSLTNPSSVKFALSSFANNPAADVEINISNVRTGIVQQIVDSSIQWDGTVSFTGAFEQVATNKNTGASVIGSTLTENFTHISGTAISGGANLKLGAGKTYPWDIIRWFDADGMDLSHSTKGKVVDFNIKVNAMAELNAAPTGRLGEMWPCKGLTVRAADDAEHLINFAITNVKGTLYFAIMGANESTVTSVSLGKSLGEQFNLRLVWNADQSLTVMVDGSIVKTFTAAEATRARTSGSYVRGGIGANVFEFWMADYNGAQNDVMDVDITGFRTGVYTADTVSNFTLGDELSTELIIPLDLAGIQLEDYGESHRFQISLMDDAGHTISSYEIPIDMDFIGGKWDAMVPSFDGVEEKATASFTTGEYAHISKTDIVDGFNMHVDAETAYNIDTLRVYAQNVMLDHSTDNKLISFDININKMPIYTAGNWGSMWPCRGLTARAADNNGNMMVFGITNTAEGLVFCIKSGEWKSAALGKQVGEQFNLRLIWNTDQTLTIQVDGKAVHTFTATEATRATSGVTAGNFEFWVFDPTENGEIDIAITNFRTGTPLPFNSLAEEVALEGLIPSVDVNNITGDFTLPTSFDSPYLGTVPMTWKSGSEAITLKTDGTAKVYRPGSRVPEYVFLTLTAFEDKEVYTREVKVAAMQAMVEQNITKLNAAFTKDAIAIDGAAEIGWNLNSKVLKDGVLGGKFGAQWDMENLYLLLETDKTPAITLNDKAIDLSTAVKAAFTEVKIPLSDLGVTVKDYGEQITAKIEMGEFVWEGIIELTSTDWFITDNVGNGIDKPVQGGYTNNSSPKNTDVSDILKVDGNGYYLYDHYVAGLADPSQMTSYIQLGRKNADDTFYAPLGDMTQDTYLEFDLFFKNMPVWAQSANTNISRNPVSYAFNYFITGDKNEFGEAPSISVGIINTQEGLLLMVHDFGDGETYRGLSSVLLGKSVGDTFRLGTRWNTADGSVSIFVDGEKVANFKDVAADRAMDANRVQLQVTRNKDLPDTSNENMDIYVTNIAFGKSNGDSLFDDLTFDTIKGENEDPYKVTSGLELPETLGGNDLGLDGALTWESSNADVIKNDGTVLRPESAGVLVTLTAKISSGAAKAFELYVPATNPTGIDTMGVTQDSDTANGAGKIEDLYQFKLDESNNSIVLDLGESKKVNVITLTDGDDSTRLNESSLSIWVSDDNVAYKRVEDDFKILRKGDKTYLYDFEAEGHYIKVHCTHYYGDEADFVGPLKGMLKAEYQNVFGDAGAEFKSEIKVTVTNDKNFIRYDDAFRFAKADAVLAGVDNASIRVFLGNELLYHYVDGEDIVVRIPEIKANGTVELRVLSKNADAMDISNKEYVHEVVYGTRELITLPNLCRYFEVLPNGALFTATGYQDSWNIGKDEGLPYYTTRYVGYSLSYDGGLTWTDHVKIEESYGGGDPNVLGWMSGMEGVLFDPTIGENGRLIITGFTNPGAGGLVQRFMYSDDLCKTWHRSNEVIFDAYPTTYYLGYTSPIRLTTADGEGPEVDYVMPVGSKDQREEAIQDNACRVLYSTDAGVTWRVSATVLTNASAELGIVGGEGGMTEASIMECDDGRLVLYCRNQGKNETQFVRAYSDDKGITWGSVELSDVYSVNTQPMLYNYGDNKLLFWSGNNSLGGESGLRYPLNVGVSDDDWKTFGNIQDLFNRYSLQGMVESYCFKVTNPDMVVFDDVLTIAWNNHGVGNTIVMRVDDFYDFLYRTKGAYDSFENSTFKYEGWTKTSGMVEASPEKASDGNKSMKIFGNSSAVRSIPYIQNGNVEFDLYVEDAATANFALELQAAFNTATGKSSAPISLEVKNGALSFRRSETDTGIVLTDGWNKIRFELDLAADTAAAKLNVNGTEAPIPLLGEAFYICYAYIVNSSTEAVYMDSFMVSDTMQVELPEKPHSPIKTDKVEPNCTEDGMEAHWTCQTCGKVFTDGLCQHEVTDMNDLVIEKHGHDLKKFDANKENCTENGNVEYYYCSICEKNFDANGKELEKVVVDAHGHSLKKTDAKKPTCTDEGNVEYYYCFICGKYFDAEGKELTKVTIEADGHDLKKTDAKKPTCTDEGNVEYYTCSVCGKHFDAEGKELTKVTIEADGHDLKKTEAKKESCTGEGNVEYYTCSVCGKHFDVNGKELIEITIDAHGHKLSKTEAKKPTCTEEGNVEYYTCSACGKHFDAAGKELTEVTVPKLTEHAFGEWEVVKEAALGIDGLKERICSVCGHKETEVIVAEGTKTNPVKVEDAKALTKAEISAGGEVYYELDKALAGMVLTVKGEGAYVVVNGSKTEAKDGLIEVKLEAKDGKIGVVIGNAGTKAGSFSITIAEVSEDNSDTGDTAAVMLFGSLLTLSALAAGVLLIPDIRKRLIRR